MLIHMKAVLTVLTFSVIVSPAIFLNPSSAKIYINFTMVSAKPATVYPAIKFPKKQATAPKYAAMAQ